MQYKQKLIKIIAETALWDTKGAEKIARKAIGAIWDKVRKGLEKGERVHIQHFGTFYIATVKAKTTYVARFAETGIKGKKIVVSRDLVTIPEHKVVRFRAYRAIRIDEESNGE